MDSTSRAKQRLELVMQAVGNLRLALQDALGDDVDPEMLEHAIEGETDFYELLARIIRDAEEEDNVAASLHKMMDDMRRRYDRMKRQADAKREIVRKAMDEVKCRERHYPDMSIYVSTGRAAVLITDEKQVPFVRTKYEPDKAAIRAALEEGKSVPGAELGIPPRILTVRTK